MARLDIRNVSKRFGATMALGGVDISIADGSFTALMGPSGCGKTTLLRIVSGLERADGGAVLIDGEDVSAAPPEKRNLGLMFQSYALFPHMTIAENLAFPMKMRRDYDAAERETRIRRALDLVRLPDIRARRPRELSGGQQQRVAFARAIIDEPRILLLDEPLSNLDARLREEMQMELIELRRQLAITTIMVTHDQSEGLTLADEIVVMRAGAVEQQGAPRAVYGDPASVFVADFLGGANLIPIRNIRRDASGWLADAPDGSAISVPSPSTDAKDGILMIRPEDMRILNSGENAPMRASATVIAVAYRGQTSQTMVAALGQRLKISTTSRILKAGEDLLVAWNTEQSRILKSET